jgi:tetratricopeptide (TPR) repeat protein
LLSRVLTISIERKWAYYIFYRAITYNNLACFYRRTGKLRTALNYLQQALDIEIKSENPQSLADTHLNMCAVLS